MRRDLPLYNVVCTRRILDKVACDEAGTFLRKRGGCAAALGQGDGDVGTLYSV